MGVPAFVTKGNLTQTSGNTTNTPALPASRTNGNVLIACVNVTSGGKTLSVGGGWTIGDQTTAGMTAGWAWRLVDGTEAAPVFSWTGNSNATGQCYQFSGNASPTPVGAFNHNNGTSTTLSISSLTTTQDNSLILVAEFVNSGTAPGTPTPFINIGSNTIAIGSSNFSEGTAYVSGSATDSSSVTIANVAWTSLVIEILGTGTATNEPRVLASQSVKQVLETYSDVTNVLATQAVLQVLRSHNSGIFPGLFTNTNTFYSPTIATGSGLQNLDPGLFTNTNIFYSPVLGDFLVPGLFTNTNIFYPPSLNFVIKPPLYTNPNSFYAPLIATELTLAPGVLTNTNIFYAPTFGNFLFPSLLVNTQTFYGPIISGSETEILAPLLLNNLATFLPPVIEAHAIIRYHDHPFKRERKNYLMAQQLPIFKKMR